MRRMLLSLPCLCLLAACGGSRWGPWPSAADRTMRPEHAPTPFTAAQIREGCPDGRVSTFLIESPGSEPGHQVFTFSDPDAEGVSFQVTLETTSGKRVRESPVRRASWEGLQAHASHASDRTQITRTTLALRAGRFHCMRYDVVAPEGKVPVVRSAWFARELPGPPVYMEERRDGELVTRMVLIENRVDTPSDE